MMEVVLSHNYITDSQRAVKWVHYLHYKGIKEKGFHPGKLGPVLVPLNLQGGCCKAVTCKAGKCA